MKTLSVFAVLAFAGSAMAYGPATIAVDGASVLGNSIPAPAGLVSALNFEANANRSAIGDSFSFAPLAQTNLPTAFFIDGNYDPGTFSVAAAPGATDLNGDLLFYQPGSVISGVFASQTQTGPNTYLIQVSYFALNATSGTPVPLVPAGAVPPAGGGTLFTSWRLDVGGFAGGSDAISLSAPVANIIGQGQFAFNSAGGLLGTFALTAGGATVGSADINGVAVLGLGGGNIAGFDLVEHGIFWEVEVVPAPGAFALLGVAGLAATRRRR